MPRHVRAMMSRVPSDHAVWCSVLATLVALLFGGCTWLDDNQLRAVKSRGELVVLTRVGPATYYDSPEGPAGFEYDLVSAFAEQLGVRLRVVTAERFADILPRLARGEADLAAAGITITAARTEVVRFTPPYQEIRQQVVHRRDLERPPGCAGALLGRQIEVIAGSSYVERLNELKHDYPELTWVEVADRPTEEVLRDVWEGLTELTVADSNIFAVNRQHFPELQVAFDLKTGDQLGWAFPLSDDDSLYQAAVKFLESMRGSGELARLIDRYYGPASRSNYVNLTIYHLRIQTRLPQYQALFERAGHQYNLDWRLLAALGYQESYWDPRAVSFTGVRGMMMLTEETATQMGVQNRLDTEQSIDGGARYLAQMIDRMPDTITGPDRAWMALAAYNLGINHVEDARILTEQQRGDPNKWNDVKDRLPLLAQARWAARTRYGFARGMEGVIFVNRVRTYFDVLTKFDQEEKAAKRSEALKLTAPAI